MKKLIIFSLIYWFISCNPHQRGGEPFPVFEILLTDSITRINTATIKEGDPIVLMYFSPDCEHCQKETEAILRHMQTLKNTRFYFITDDPLDRLKIFKGVYKLGRFTNIILGKDEQFFLLRHFKGVYPPYLVLYDRQKRQRSAYEGDIPVDTIISFVNHL